MLDQQWRIGEAGQDQRAFTLVYVRPGWVGFMQFDGLGHAYPAVPSPSPSKPLLTSSTIASSASRACLPLACTRMVEPGPAPSIISPMMELPLTDVPSLMTLIAASKHSALRTKRAEARACRPLRLTRVNCWATARLPPAPSIIPLP